METKAKILAHEYRLICDHTLREEEEELGYCDYGSLIIGVDGTIPESMTKEVLMHEFMEAINFHLETGLKHSQLSAIAVAVYGLMKDNRDLFVDYILNENSDKSKLNMIELHKKERNLG